MLRRGQQFVRMVHAQFRDLVLESNSLIVSQPGQHQQIDYRDDALHGGIEHCPCSTVRARPQGLLHAMGELVVQGLLVLPLEDKRFSVEMQDMCFTIVCHKSSPKIYEACVVNFGCG